MSDGDPDRNAERKRDRATPLRATLDAVERAADGERTTVGDLAENLEHRGFGPALIALAGLLLLPTGMIPGAPAAIGLAMIAVGGQLLAGMERPWAPKRLRDVAVSSRLVAKAVERARPLVRRLDWLVGRRLPALATGAVAVRLIAVAVIASGAVIIPFGFIPFLPFAFSLPVLCFGVALAARDGLVALIGYVVYAPGLWLLVTQAG